MKLSYLALEGDGLGPGVVLVHGEGPARVDDMVRVVRDAGLMGAAVVPFGNYVTTPSGMEAGGSCWYRVLPGGTGTDPLTLARAVVQMTDLLDDSVVERPVLVGWRQGAAVVLGSALLTPTKMSAVVAVDPPAADLARLPESLSTSTAPPALLVDSGSGDVDLDAARGELEPRGVEVEVSKPAAPGTSDGQGTTGVEFAAPVAAAIAAFLRTMNGRPMPEARPS